MSLRNYQQNDNPKEKAALPVFRPFFQALLNPSRALVFQASPSSTGMIDSVDLSKEYTNRLQVLGFSTAASKAMGIMRDMEVNTGNMDSEEYAENKRFVYRYCQGFMCRGSDEPYSSFATPLAVSTAVWLRENRFAEEPWTPELVTKIGNTLRAQKVWNPLHEGQTMGQHLGYISARISDTQRLNELGYPQFKDWEEACHTLRNPNLKTVQDLKEMIEQNTCKECQPKNPNLKTVQDLKEMIEQNTCKDC